jgi:hypothetical protein
MFMAAYRPCLNNPHHISYGKRFASRINGKPFHPVYRFLIQRMAELVHDQNDNRTG